MSIVTIIVAVFFGWIYWTIIRDDPASRARSERKQKERVQEEQEAAHYKYLEVYRCAAENRKFEFLGGCYMTTCEYEEVSARDFDGSSAWNAICPSGRYWYRRYRVEKGINGGFPLKPFEQEWKEYLEKTDALVKKGKFEFKKDAWMTPEEYQLSEGDPWNAEYEMGRTAYRTWYVTRRAKLNGAV